MTCIFLENFKKRHPRKQTGS